MYRAAKKIDFFKKTLISNGGEIIAPVINLHGLILRADRPIPAPIYSFLESKGIKIDIVRYKSDVVVCLSGNYQVTASEISNFILSNKKLCQEQQKNIDTIQPAFNIQNEIKRKVEMGSQKLPLMGTYKNEPYSLSGGIMFAGTLFEAKAAKADKNKGRNISGGNMVLNSQEQISEGKTNGVIGFFAERIAKNNISAKNNLGYCTNAIIEAGNTLKIEPIEADEESSDTLTIDNTIHWFNKPETNTKNVAMNLDEVDDFLFDIRNGLR